MRILLDENCSNLKALLLELNWSVVTVNDVIGREAGKNSVSDDDVLEYAIDHKLVIVTRDKGLKRECGLRSVPFVSLGSPELEAKIVDDNLKKMSAWKDYL